MTPRIELLGGITVRGTATTRAGGLPGRRAELVFAYLAAEHHRVVTRDELADALWPEILPDSWAAALRGVVSEVRRYLEDAGLPPAEVLTTERQGYRLRFPEATVVDLDEARQELALARARLDAGGGAQAAAHAARSATLAARPFLPSHDGDWVDGVRRELESIHARALDAEAAAHRAAGDLAAAALAAERLVRSEPFGEAGHQLRIRILGEAGDRVGAIAAYEHCRTVLADELGVEPSAETKAALQAALHAAASPRSPGRGVAAGPPAETPPATPNTLDDLSVLVVEDHDFQRRTLLRLLTGLGVRSLAEAADGAAALKLLAESPQPDVIICDIDMPGMDGVQFISRVAERGLASAVVIASGLDSKVVAAVKAIGESHGIQLLGAVEKPLTGRRVAELLGSYRRPPAGATSGAELSVTTAEVVSALSEGGITTLFAPVVDLTECRVSGAEAAGRWAHPTKGPVGPETFLPVLSSDGLLPYVEAVLEDACAVVRRCAEAGLRMGIGVDVPPRILGDHTLADRLTEAVRKGGVDPGDVTCEVAAHLLSDAPPAALDVMTRLRVKGFGLALDGFGTRRPPTARLAQIPCTLVKIDGNLVGGAASGPPRELLEETLDVAQSLDIPVLADGCENEADFDLAVELGFRYAQGGFLGGSLTADGLVELAGSWKPPGAGGPGPR